VSEEAQAAASHDAYIGSRLAGRYDVLHQLGSAERATVYAGRQAGDGRKVAIKVLHGLAADTLDRPEVFLREARVIGQLDGDARACEVRDAGVTSDGTPFIVLELLSGRSLASELLEAAPLPQRRAVALARRIASEVQAAHELGIAHRALEPGKVWLRGSAGADEIRVLDFAGAQQPAAADSDGAATRKGLAATTADRLEDVRALGAILQQMLAGKASDPSLAVPLHPQLAAVVSRATAAGGDGFGSMAELARALDALLPVLPGRVPRGRPQGRQTRRSRRPRRRSPPDRPRPSSPRRRRR
jgi:hypothetical protein